MFPIVLAQAGLAEAGIVIMVILALLGILGWVVGIYLTGYIAAWG